MGPEVTAGRRVARPSVRGRLRRCGRVARRRAAGRPKRDELCAPYEPERLVTAGEHRYDAAANWKTLTENYHECYHCPSIHPELCRGGPPKSGENYASAAAWIGVWRAPGDGL